MGSNGPKMAAEAAAFDPTLRRPSLEGLKIAGKWCRISHSELSDKASVREAMKDKASIPSVDGSNIRHRYGDRASFQDQVD